MKISLIGNCQIKALTWYIQELNSDFDVKYIWTDIGMDSFAKKNVFNGKSTPTIINAKASQDRLSESDYIIYQPIRPSRIKKFNYEDIQKYRDRSKLISVGCFYCREPNSKDVDPRKYEEKTGLIGMKERAKKFQLDIQPHKIIEQHEINAITTNNPYHPRTLYFTELVREICAQTGWRYYNNKQYNQLVEERYPFG